MQPAKERIQHPRAKGIASASCEDRIGAEHEISLHGKSSITRSDFVPVQFRGPTMENEEKNEKKFIESELKEAPAGVDRRSFLMRSATIGAAAVLTGCTTQEKTRRLARRHLHRRRRRRPWQRRRFPKIWMSSRRQRGR
jgi:hypothetical protein